MLKNLSLGVDAIEGIGPKTTKVLANDEIHTLLDLIAETPGEIHRKVAKTTSFDEVNSWIRMALFMQIDAIDSQLAEALVRSGVKTISRIAYTSAEALLEIFTQAEAENIIPQIPETLTIFEMIREATILTFSQTFTGKLVDDKGVAVEGAEVKVYYQKSISNSNGLIRLFGLVSGNDKLFVRKPTGETYCFESYHLSRYPDNIALIMLSLDADHLVEVTPLSEYNGDRLPDRGSFPKQIKNHNNTSLRKNDIFLVREVDETKKMAKLQSIFSEFDGTKFIVNIYSYAIDKINISITERSYIKYGIGGFRVLKGDRSMVRFWKTGHQALTRQENQLNKKIKITF